MLCSSFMQYYLLTGECLMPGTDVSSPERDHTQSLPRGGLEEGRLFM